MAGAPEDRETARRLFDEASAFEEAENWQQAIPKLRSALELVQTPGLEYHLAYCLEQSGDLVEAMDHYRRAEQLIQSGTAAPDVEKLLTPRLASLKERLPTVTVSVDPEERPTNLHVDGSERPLDLLGKPIPVNPGKHRIVVRAADRAAPIERELTVAEREHPNLEIAWPKPKIVPVSVPPPRSEPAATYAAADAGSSSGWSARTWVLITEGSLALVSLGAGVGFTLAAHDKSKTVDALQAKIQSTSGSEPQHACVDAGSNAERCDRLSAAARDEQRFRDIALAGYVSGGVLAVATVGTWLLWKPKPKSQSGLGIRVMPTAGGVAWSAEGCF
jgi:tetratricopeptide (TPR) repeat protein